MQFRILILNHRMRNSVPSFFYFEIQYFHSPPTHLFENILCPNVKHFLFWQIVILQYFWFYLSLIDVVDNMDIFLAVLFYFIFSVLAHLFCATMF